MIAIESIVKFDEICNNKNIVVVGNSAFDTPKGSIIDEHDVVIKFNHGAVLGEKNPEYFGKKCTIWNYAMNNEDICFNRYKQFKTKPDYILRWGKVQHKDLQFSMNIPANHNIAKEIGIRKNPSSGIIMIHYIVNNINYKKLSITGFDGFETINFYEKCKVNKAERWHDPDGEKRYIKGLIDNKKLERI